MGYKDIIIPEGKNPIDYFVKERRAEIFKLIMAAGHPGLISRVELGKRYGITGQMISKDMKVIAQEVSKEMGTDAEYVVHTVFESTIRDLRKGNNRDKFNAAKLAKDWYEWLQGMGLKKKAAQDINITGLSMEEAIIKFIEKRKNSGISQPEKAKSEEKKD